LNLPLLGSVIVVLVNTQHAFSFFFVDEWIDELENEHLSINNRSSHGRYLYSAWQSEINSTRIVFNKWRSCFEYNCHTLLPGHPPNILSYVMYLREDVSFFTFQKLNTWVLFLSFNRDHNRSHCWVYISLCPSKECTIEKYCYGLLAGLCPSYPTPFDWIFKSSPYSADFDDFSYSQQQQQQQQQQQFKQCYSVTEPTTTATTRSPDSQLNSPQKHWIVQSIECEFVWFKYLVALVRMSFPFELQENPSNRKEKIQCERNWCWQFSLTNKTNTQRFMLPFVFQEGSIFR
jgi:hypothetical protein